MAAGDLLHAGPSSKFFPEGNPKGLIDPNDTHPADFETNPATRGLFVKPKGPTLSQMRHHGQDFVAGRVFGKYVNPDTMEFTTKYPKNFKGGSKLWDVAQDVVGRKYMPDIWTTNDPDRPSFKDRLKDLASKVGKGAKKALDAFKGSGIGGGGGGGGKDDALQKAIQDSKDAVIGAAANNRNVGGVPHTSVRGSLSLGRGGASNSGIKFANSGNNNAMAEIMRSILASRGGGGE
jgi:hypothetical protein